MKAILTVKLLVLFKNPFVPSSGSMIKNFPISEILFSDSSDIAGIFGNRAETKILLIGLNWKFLEENLTMIIMM